MMLDYLSEKTGRPALLDAARLIEAAIEQGFAENRLRPMEFGGDMGTKAVTRDVIDLVGGTVSA